tara:strand:+ start:2725 stop:3894 length:1170 start_codon:yes stop_codon:yes gene_type:complete
MKILYVGCYKDGTGWGNAAQGYILALDKSGVEIVPRFIKLNDREVDIPERIKELERNDSKNCDVVIQHVLPHHSYFRGEFDKNISLYVTETSNCNSSLWPEKINLMDEAWVPNTYMASEQAKNSNIFTPHHVVPHAFDMTKYQKEYEPLEIPQIQDTFVFYYIGENTKRKNISAILKAFHLEFRKHEPVSLVIKSHSPGLSEHESFQSLQNLCEAVKRGLKLYKNSSDYKKEIFICDYLTDDQIMRIHQTCNCHVSTSFGEAWSIPTFEAMAMGNTPICTDTGGPRDYLPGGGYLIDSSQEPCFGVMDTFDYIYTGSESWDTPSIRHLRECMRDAFENKESREKMADEGIKKAYDYSYANVGNTMKKILLDNVEPFRAERKGSVMGDMI